MRYRILLFIVIWPIITYGQENEDLWASPSVEGMNLGKGIIIGYFRNSPYDIKSESQVPDLVDDANGDIDRIRNMNAKLRLPVMVKERSQMVIGFEYSVGQFEFENPEQESYPFYKRLHHKDLHSRAFKIYHNLSFDERKFIFTRASIELNGDILDEWWKGLKYTVSSGYGWKLNPRTAWGIGFYFSYSFGAPTLLPGILYNKTWNSKWGLEALFPGMAQLRYRANDKNIFYLGYEVFGASYNIELGDALNERFENIQLRRSEVMPVFRYEKEIYDFIWFSVETGFRYNLNFNITEDNIFNEKEILINEVGSGTFIGVNVFIVPTESLKAFFKKKN